MAIARAPVQRQEEGTAPSSGGGGRGFLGPALRRLGKHLRGRARACSFVEGTGQAALSLCPSPVQVGPTQCAVSVSGVWCRMLCRA